MFGFLKTDPLKSLQKEYDKLMHEAFVLSRSNRKLSSQKYAEAERVSQQMDQYNVNRN